MCLVVWLKALKIEKSPNSDPFFQVEISPMFIHVLCLLIVPSGSWYLYFVQNTYFLPEEGKYLSHYQKPEVDWSQLFVGSVRK